MSIKEDVLNEIEITARTVGIDAEKARTLSAKIALLLRQHIEGSQLAISVSRSILTKALSKQQSERWGEH